MVYEDLYSPSKILTGVNTKGL